MNSENYAEGIKSLLPLQGVRVLDLGHVVAGPFCTMMLADAGAEVIKIERPIKGETSRGTGPFRAADDSHSSSGTFVRMNRNKKGITLNLKDPKGKSLFLDLVKQADVVVENFSPGTMEKLGLGYKEVLSAANPQIIYASITGFGPPQSGPYWNMPAFNLIAQAMGGIMGVTGHAETAPAYVGVPIGDLIPAMVTANGILLALYHRKQTGKGQAIDVAMYDTMVWLFERVFNIYQYSGKVPTRGHDSVVCPHGAYIAMDGYFVVDVYTEEEWKDFCHLTGYTQLLSDADFSSGAKRAQKEEFLRKIIENWAADKTKFEAVNMMSSHGIPAAVVQTIEDILQCQHLKQRGMLVKVDDPAGQIVYPSNPLNFSFSRKAELSPAPRLGQDTRNVLYQLLNLSGTELDELTEKGII